MTRRRGLRLGLIALAAMVVVALVAGVVLAQVFLRRPLPDYSGEVTLAGLEAPVRVLRDGRGVPQVYADTTADLFRAQGYVQAQDRFFEMDLRRHVTAGRLSELVGPSEEALQADTVVRTLGWRRVAQAELAVISPQSRSVLEAYAAGVNDYLRERGSSELSVNYTILGLSHTLPRIEPWTAVDSLSWLKAMAWDLKANYTEELDRARVYGTVDDVARVNQLFPVYPFDRHDPILAEGTPQAGAGLPRTGDGRRAAAPALATSRSLEDALASSQAQQALDAVQVALDAVPSLMGADTGEIGSNSWVVSGRFTATGRPLLANDPHLATSAPGIWHQVGLRCTEVSQQCPYDVAGFSLAGVPGVLVGHTGEFAWGITNMYPDVSDFYLEQVSEGTYLRDGRQVPLETREEVIEVAGAEPVTVTVRSTAHGPLLSDAVEAVETIGSAAPEPEISPARGAGYAVSLAWTALTPARTMDAILGIDAATDFESFRQAGLLSSAPAQNLVYADVNGVVGYQAPGLIPLRRATPAGAVVPSDGSWPQPGWDSSFDWQGFVAPQDLPFERDPAEGFLVAANQAVVGPSFPVRFTNDWDYGYRSQRIRELIERRIAGGAPVKAADMTALQADTRNPIAPDLLPVLLQADVDDFTQEAQDLLRAWRPEFGQDEESAAAAYFNAVWATLLGLTFNDELPEGARPTGGGRWYEVVRTLLESPTDPWWDDKRTPDVVETRDEVVRQALVEARLDLTSNLGKDPERWEWGRLHRVTLRQTPLGGDGAPGLVHRLVNRGPYDAPGGTAAVSAFSWDASEGTYDVTAGPSMRMVVDLGDLDASTWVNQTGISAHPGDDHYDDQVDAWLSGRAYPWPFTREAVEQAAEQELVLSPPQR